MKLTSAGAAQTVTGSCHFFQFNGLNVLLDCGLFQGPKEIDALNEETFPFNIQDIDVVLISHGHLDHIGRLPLLIKQGYSGPILSTRATQKISEVILQDSAKIQFEDYQRSLRKAQRSGREKEVKEPLYTKEDVTKTISQFRSIDFASPIDLGNKVIAKFFPAGHILGSAFIDLESPDLRLIASGDLGNRESSLQATSISPRECDFVLVETTYANRNHRALEATQNEFTEVILRSLKGKGKVIIPSFALERTQNILFTLKTLQEKNILPPLKVFLDSPMATKMTKFYQECANEFQQDVAQDLLEDNDPFEPEFLSYSVTTDESKEINEVEGLAIIIAGSGMMTGGRVVHHLKHNLWRKDTSLVVVGYQAEGTLGRRIVNGAKRIRLFGEDIVVRASIHTIGGFSAHADQDDLLHWLSSTGKAKVFMVHGEVPVMEDFQKVLGNHDRQATIVERNKTYNLSSLT